MGLECTFGNAKLLGQCQANSQAVLRELESTTIRSKMVNECLGIVLRILGAHNKVILQWVHEHQGIEGKSVCTVGSQRITEEEISILLDGRPRTTKIKYFHRVFVASKSCRFAQV